LIKSLLVAVDEKNGIGKDGRLPWHLSADLQLFKKLSMGHHILMGRKTYESIGRLLPGRKTMILTRSDNFEAPGAILVSSLEEALELAGEAGETELLIIGGGQVFEQALPIADRIYLTRVHTDAKCQVFFPALNKSDWVELEKGYHPADEKNDHAFTFSRLEKSPAKLP